MAYDTVLSPRSGSKGSVKLRVRGVDKELDQSSSISPAKAREILRKYNEILAEKAQRKEPLDKVMDEQEEATRKVVAKTSGLDRDSTNKLLSDSAQGATNIINKDRNEVFPHLRANPVSEGAAQANLFESFAQVDKEIGNASDFWDTSFREAKDLSSQEDSLDNRARLTNNLQVLKASLEAVIKGAKTFAPQSSILELQKRADILYSRASNEAAGIGLNNSLREIKIGESQFLSRTLRELGRQSQLGYAYDGVVGGEDASIWKELLDNAATYEGTYINPQVSLGTLNTPEGQMKVDAFLNEGAQKILWEEAMAGMNAELSSGIPFNIKEFIEDFSEFLDKSPIFTGQGKPYAKGTLKEGEGNIGEGLHKASFLYNDKGNNKRAEDVKEWMNNQFLKDFAQVKKLRKLRVIRENNEVADRAVYEGKRAADLFEKGEWGYGEDSIEHLEMMSMWAQSALSQPSKREPNPSNDPVEIITSTGDNFTASKGIKSTDNRTKAKAGPTSAYALPEQSEDRKKLLSTIAAIEATKKVLAQGSEDGGTLLSTLPELVLAQAEYLQANTGDVDAAEMMRKSAKAIQLQLDKNPISQLDGGTVGLRDLSGISPNNVANALQQAVLGDVSGLGGVMRSWKENYADLFDPNNTDKFPLEQVNVEQIQGFLARTDDETLPMRADVIAEIGSNPDMAKWFGKYLSSTNPRASAAMYASIISPDGVYPVLSAKPESIASAASTIDRLYDMSPEMRQAYAGIVASNEEVRTAKGGEAEDLTEEVLGNLVADWEDGRASATLPNFLKDNADERMEAALIKHMKSVAEELGGKSITDDGARDKSITDDEARSWIELMHSSSFFSFGKGNDELAKDMPYRAQIMNPHSNIRYKLMSQDLTDPSNPKAIMQAEIIENNYKQPTRFNFEVTYK